MDLFCPDSGSISQFSITTILSSIYREKRNCILKLFSGTMENSLFIENRTVFFAKSNSPDENLGQYLLRKKIITPEILEDTAAIMEKKKLRFGKALVRLGVINYDQLFNFVSEHLSWVAFSCLTTNHINYKIENSESDSTENIRIALDLGTLLAESSRNHGYSSEIEKKLPGINKIYLHENSNISSIKLKKYEEHIVDLIKRNVLLEDILRKSELSREETLRIIYLLIISGIVSDKIKDTKIANPDSDTELVNSSGSFTSFIEALKFYNSKYEIIFKILSKEIGPVAGSILLRAIDSVRDKLPSYMKNAKLNSEGSLIEDKIMKKVWYNDFEDNIPAFLKGLEEILYAEIYTVKKNLGIEYEKQVLKMLKEIR